jgi:hypothetical protein
MINNVFSVLKSLSLTDSDSAPPSSILVLGPVKEPLIAGTGRRKERRCRYRV